MLWGIIFVPSSNKLCLLGGYIWQPIWELHLTSHLCHFICQVAGGYIWALHLFQMGSHWQHGSAKNSPPGTCSFIWGFISAGCCLKIWTHFGFDSCFTEVFSMKYQQDSLPVACLAKGLWHFCTNKGISSHICLSENSLFFNMQHFITCKDGKC